MFYLDIQFVHSHLGMIYATYILERLFVCHFGLCTFFVFYTKFFGLGLRMFKYNDNNKNRYNDASYSYNNINQSGEISPVENYEIEIIATRPALNK